MNVKDIKEVKIGNIIYSIRFTSGKKLERMSGERFCDGLIHYHNKVIYLKKGVNIQYSLSVLWHEILHGLYFERNVDVNKKNNEEDVVEDGAAGIIQILRDNPDLVKITSLRRWF